VVRRRRERFSKAPCHASHPGRVVGTPIPWHHARRLCLDGRYHLAAEEIGWQGYAYPRLTLRYSPLQAALIIGVVWALWHIIPFALMGHGAEWIMWHSLGMVCMRIIIVWLFVNTGKSILIAVLFHVMSNFVWGLFTNFDPWYDPLFMCVVLLIAVAAIVWISKYERRILGVTGPGKQSTLRL
jgi:Type II CAAX prenyl endopeptidase Rce1-like